MEKLAQSELKIINTKIIHIYDDLVGKYDDTKYPENAYKLMKAEFSRKNIKNVQIKNAMVWKWGHWGKNNFPQHHKNLISLIEEKWGEYIEIDSNEAKLTYDFWLKALEKNHRFISVSFITHLIHYKIIPIIDQHNYRGMNHLLKASGRNEKKKKKPSNWTDIINLEIFLTDLSNYLEKDIREVDKFLMMYGRYCAPR